MRVAVISDIHSNLAALRTALSYIHTQSVDKVICLGDAVGYGPHPNQCIQLLQKNAHVCIMGNHDHAVLGLTDPRYFNLYARQAVEWTQRVLTEESRFYLKKLPLFHKENGFLFVHSTPVHPEQWEYIFSERQARRYIELMEEQVCFIGHSHIPGVFPAQEPSFYEEETKLDFRKQKYIVNVGSVGQPRDRDPRLCFVLFDTDTGYLKFVRLEYPVEETYQQILENGLPHFLARRILEGY